MITEYEKVRDYRVLTFEGVQSQSRIQENFVGLIEEHDLTEMVKTIQPKKLGSLLLAFDLLDKDSFIMINSEIDNMVQTKIVSELCEKVCEINLFNRKVKKVMVRKHLGHFLFLVEPEVTLDDVAESMIIRQITQVIIFTPRFSSDYLNAYDLLNDLTDRHYCDVLSLIDFYRYKRNALFQRQHLSFQKNL